MENVKIISNNGIEINVNGLFYVFNSKYYFIYTEKEIDENGYIKLYIVQVCKEIQNTPTGPIDTGYMLGMEISDPDEWKNVQESITRIVEDKKNGTQSAEVQYLPMNMLVNLKIVSKNKFKLMRHIIEENFGVNISQETITKKVDANNNIEPQIIQSIESLNSISQEKSDNQNSMPPSDVIIDYRARFFEEQEKNRELEEQVKSLKEKLDNIRNMIG